MKILNFGSLNLDYTYSVPHIVEPGETLLSAGLSVFPGGKGLNQSVALARAGAEVFHAGMIGEDGTMLLCVLKENGVDTTHVKTVQERTGNAVIQVSATGENSIVLYGGANRANTKANVDEVLSGFGEGDWVLLQNEINLVDYIIEKAAEKRIKIILNPSPYDETIAQGSLEKVSVFLINEVEGRQITGKRSENDILACMKERYPNAETVLTLGSKGAVFASQKEDIEVDAYQVKAVDTTAAGDTFTGYFIAEYMVRNGLPKCALETAAKAAAISVTRQGAVPSIPEYEELGEFL